MVGEMSIGCCNDLMKAGQPRHFNNFVCFLMYLPMVEGGCCGVVRVVVVVGVLNVVGV
jgi:hypothetical protein